jgi:hypothetical protein
VESLTVRVCALLKLPPFGEMLGAAACDTTVDGGGFDPQPRFRLTALRISAALIRLKTGVIFITSSLSKMFLYF